MNRPSSPKTSPVRTRVAIDGTPDYPAVVDPADRWNGFVSPYFTLDTVRQLSAETLDGAAKGGYDCFDTIHVIDGGTTSDGTPRAVVLHVRWMYLEEEAPSATIISPREEDGLYGIGGWEWTWSISTWDCACSSWYYHETDPCPNCGGEHPSRFELTA